MLIWQRLTCTIIYWCNLGKTVLKECAKLALAISAGLLLFCNYFSRSPFSRRTFRQGNIDFIYAITIDSKSADVNVLGSFLLLAHFIIWIIGGKNVQQIGSFLWSKHVKRCSVVFCRHHHVPTIEKRHIGWVNVWYVCTWTTDLAVPDQMTLPLNNLPYSQVWIRTCSVEQ